MDLRARVPAVEEKRLSGARTMRVSEARKTLKERLNKYKIEILPAVWEDLKRIEDYC